MGFGDVSMKRAQGGHNPYGFGAAYQKQQKPRQIVYPTLNEASANVNKERRLQAAGAEVPQVKPKQNLLTKALDILDRPGAAVRGAVYEAYKGSNAGAMWDAARQGFTGQKKVQGSDVMNIAAQRGAPLAVAAQKSKAGKFVGGVATEILLDPTTFITGGTAKVAQQAGKRGFGKAVQREVYRETGRNISRESAERIARNAAGGNVPVGRMGTAVHRAMGYTAETTPVRTGFGAVSQAQQRVAKTQEAKGFAAASESAAEQAKALNQEAKQLTGYSPTRGVTGRIAWAKNEAAAQRSLAKEQKQLATQTKKEVKSIRVPETMANLTQVASTPGKSKTTLRFMGVPFLNVTPVRTALGAVVERSQTATKVKDALGRVFSFNYTPAAIKGVERALVTGAKQRVTQAVREIPHIREQSMKEVAGQWKKVSKEAAGLAPDVIEETITGTPEAQRAARIASDMFERDATRFAAEGIPLNVVDNYVQHLYTDPPQKVRAVIDRWRMGHAGRQVAGARPNFTKQRSIPTLEEARQLGLNPISDARQLTMIHRALSEQAVVLQRMGRDLVSMGKGVVQDMNPGGWANVSDSAIPALKGKWIHPEVHQALKNLYPVISNTDEGVQLAAATVDSMVRAWKAMVLFRPSFHIRNFIGNVFLNIADGVFNPMRYPQAAAILSGAIPYVEIAGRRVPVNVVKEWFGMYALKGQGSFREALHGSTRAVTEDAARMLAALERNGLQKVAYWARHPFEGSRLIGEKTDSLSRMANFLHHLDSGLDPTAAAQRTRRALFDYGELTPAENNIRRWVMPFYAWTRFAMPRMVERLVGAPGIFTGAMHIRENAVSLNEVDERNMPEWLRDMQAVPLWVDEKGHLHYLTLNLPLTELTRIHDPRDVQESIKELALMLNPLYTVPYQMAANQVLFSGQKITEFEDVGGPMKWRDYAMYGLGQMGMPREIANNMRETQMQKEIEKKTAEGKAVEILPTERGPLEKLGISSVQNPAQWARAAEYRRGELLDRAIEAAKMQSIDVPDTGDLAPLAEKKGFGSVTAELGGSGFGAVSRQQMLRDTGEAPVVIKQAMEMAGVDQSWGPYLKLLMRSESGGNPVAVNPLWVNYNTGQTSRRKEGSNWHRATGLYQMMQPTFDQYKVPGHDDIYSPLDNSLAAIRYIQSRYGHPANIPRLGQSGYRGY